MVDELWAVEQKGTMQAEQARQHLDQPLGADRPGHVDSQSISGVPYLTTKKIRSFANSKIIIDEHHFLLLKYQHSHNGFTLQEIANEVLS